MSAEYNGHTQDEFKKATELKVVVTFERDQSAEGKMRSSQAKLIICQLILLAQKRGRPSMKEEVENEAA